MTETKKILILLLAFVVGWGICSIKMINSNYYPYDPAMQRRVYGRTLDENEYSAAMKAFDFMKLTPLSIVMVIGIIKSKFKRPFFFE